MAIWVFAHGSLMIEPPYPVMRSQSAVVQGWQRSFGHPSIRNWGSSKAPAPTSALVSGGAVSGVAHLVDPIVVRHIAAREASEPVEVTATVGGSSVAAKTWLMSDAWSLLSPARLAGAAIANVEAGGGPMGNAIDYLELVHRALVHHAVSDESVERYLEACRAAGVTRVAPAVSDRDEDL